MAYKFFTGNLNTSGTLNVENAITGNALLVDTGGITVTAGNIIASTAQLTASAVSASSAQFGSLAVATLSAPNLDLTGYLNVDGAVRLGNGDTQATTISGSTTNDILIVKADVEVAKVNKNNGLQVLVGNISGSGQLQIGNVATIGGLVTANSGIKNYGTDLRSINQKIVVRDAGDANDKALLDGSGQVSGSGALNIGGAATIGNGLTVNGGVASTINNRLNLGADGGTISVSGSGQAQFGGTGTFNGLTINGAATFNNNATFNQDVTIRNLYVTGTMTAVQSQDLMIKDAKVIIASGTVGTGSFDTLDPAGIYVGGNSVDGSDAFGRISLIHNAGAWSWQVYASGAIDPTLQVGGGNTGAISIGSTQVLAQSKLFQGAVTGSSAGVGLRITASEKTADYTMAISDYVVAVDTNAAAGAVTITLPASEVGRVYLIKDSGGQANTKNITITRAGSDLIDGLTSVKLESPYAAVSVVCVATNKWSLF